jgi:hypothetical protein
VTVPAIGIMPVASGDQFSRAFIAPSLASVDSIFPNYNTVVNYDEQFDASFQPYNLIGSYGIGDFDSFENFPSTATTVSGMNGYANTDIQTTVSAFDSLPLPPAGITPPAPRADINAKRLMCPRTGCTTTFARPGDLRRHTRKHLKHEYHCPVDNCDRKGDKAFYRRDKLLDHQRKVHGMTV